MLFRSVSLLEPPVALEEPSVPDPLGSVLAELIAAGRNGDAVVHFHTSIGVPDELVAGLRDAPYWPLIEAAAPTLVYDTMITESMTAEKLAAITTPALVVNSVDSDDDLRSWSAGVADALPNARHLPMRGEWHGVANDDLAPVLTEFFVGSVR